VKGVVATIHFAMGGEGLLRGGGEQAAAAANGEGGGDLAFGRRKEKSNWASAGPKGGGGPAGLLRRIGHVAPQGHVGPDGNWVGAGEKKKKNEIVTD
jgi:hypothetical protein